MTAAPAALPSSDARPGSKATWRLVSTSAASKLAVMGVSGVISVFTVRLVLHHFGVAAYAQYGLLVSMAAMLPFSDLGMAAAVINSVAASASPSTDEVVRRTLVSALRVVTVSGGAIVAVGLALTATGAWPAVLGEGLLPGSGPPAALLCLVLFAVTLPLAVGQRVLTALGQNHVRILLQGVSSPLFAVSVVLLVLTGAHGGGYLAVLSYAGGALVAACGCVVASRRLGGLARAVLRDVPRPRRAPGVAVLDVAWPMLVQTLALPIAMQTDRLLLSHLASPRALAEYNLSWSVFGILLQTITSAGIVLWPVFARARSTAQVRSPFAMSTAFFGGALLLSVLMALLMPDLAAYISAGRITVDAWSIWGFVAFLAVQAANYPPGMYMTDAAGLRFQVPCIVAMVPVNLGLSWWLAVAVGPGGPIIASAVSVAICQLLPALWYVRRDMARRLAVTAA